MVEGFYLEYKAGGKFQKQSSVPPGKTQVLACLILCPHRPFLCAPAQEGRAAGDQAPPAQMPPERLWFDFPVSAVPVWLEQRPEQAAFYSPSPTTCPWTSPHPPCEPDRS